jgi:hypothetical protein
VEVVQTSQEGVSALRFVFERPLNDPRYRFFLSSGGNFARGLQFDSWATEDPVARTPLEMRDSDRLRRMQMAYRRFVYVLDKWPF